MLKSTYKNIKITGISTVVPDDKDTNNYSRNNVYTSPIGVTNVDMCEAAAKDILENMNISSDSLDALIFINQYPDHLSPSSSHIIHRRLKLPSTCIVFDVYHGGAGYIYGLWIAGAMVSSGSFKKILVLAGDHINSFNTNFNQNLNLSSSGTATLLEYDESASESFFIFSTDSSKWQDIAVPAGAYRLPITHSILDEVIMDSNGNQWTLMQKIYNIPSFEEFIYNNVPDCILNLLSYSKYNIKDVDFFAFNQFSKEVVNKLAEILNIPDKKYSTHTYDNFGNQTVVSSLFNLIDFNESNLLNSKKRVCLVGYGEGMSCGCTILDIDHIYVSGILKVKFDNCIMPDDYAAYWIDHMKNSK